MTQGQLVHLNSTVSGFPLKEASKRQHVLDTFINKIHLVVYYDF